MFKITHLIPRDGLGGVETAARSMSLAGSLACDFSVVFIGGEVCYESDRSMSVSPSLSESSVFAHFRALRHILNNRPDVLICSLWRSVLIGVLVKVLQPEVKLVHLLHSSLAAHTLEKFFDRLMLFVCDAVWCDSETTRDSRVGNVRKVDIRVISFVTDVATMSRSTNKLEPRFVFWGRLNKLKGLDRSIRLIAMLIERGCSASYEIWGPDDGERKILLNLLDEIGIRESVSFRGPANQEQLDHLAGCNSFFLQLSRQEGMAMAVVEAMQRYLVTIVTPVGEIGSYCKHGENSIVVDDPDNPSETVEEILAILEDEGRYRKMQTAASDTWDGHELYTDDICKSAKRLLAL